MLFPHRLIGEEGEKLGSKIGPVSIYTRLLPHALTLSSTCVYIYLLIDAERSLHLPSEGEQYVQCTYFHLRVFPYKIFIVPAFLTLYIVCATLAMHTGSSRLIR